MILRQVACLDDPDLEPYVTLRGRTVNWRDNVFVAEGAKVVHALLASECTVVSFLLSPSWFDAVRTELERERFAETVVFVGPEALLQKIVGFKLHQNVLALAQIPSDTDLDAVVQATRPGSVSVALEGVSDAENMGMILRNCAAFGVTALVAGPDSCNPYLRRSVRVSLGTVLSVRVYRPADIHAALAELRERHGWLVVGATSCGGKSDLDEWACAGRQPLCLLFGSEAHGLTRRALEACDGRFTIPMEPAIDSINVANAVAVALNEARRRR